MNETDRRKFEKSLNLLLVPFPFKIDGNCFVAGEVCLEGCSTLGRFFSVDQRWLRNGDQPLLADEISRFLIDLVHEAERDVEEINGIIMPELALDDGLATNVAKSLAEQSRNIELFVCGLATDRESIPSNSTKTFLFKKDTHSGQRQVFSYWQQAKHHRWCLDNHQIRRYSLGDQLKPQNLWWEHANIGERGCVFYMFRHGMSIATLICEDLARIDPVQAVIRAVGPNLVIALLMDGPQLERRWSGRYATVLADDPGSAVLTLTSLGLMRRSVRPGEPEPRQIALWKSADGLTEELNLPRGHHALTVTLTHAGEENFTLDGRSDDGATYRLSLSGVRGVRHPDPPKWIFAE